jgi:hypothetical protein
LNEKLKLKHLLESENFRIRTAMFIGEKRISTLKSFFDGIYYSFDIYNIKEENIFLGLNEWTIKYYNWKETSAGWKDIILKECENDEEKAVDEFFRIYDKFKQKPVANTVYN